MTETTTGALAPTPRQRFRAGLRAGIPFGLAAGVLSISFAVIALDAGLSPLATIMMSVVVFAGSAQFASVAIFGGGGSLAAAIVAAALAHSRFLPMGASIGPSLPGGPLRRALQGQTVVDSSWALAARPDGSFDRWLLFGSTLPQYVMWQVGTIAGAFAGDVIGDPDRLGLDAVFPTFFLVLLIGELRNGRAKSVALAGAAIALVLVPITPIGVPVLVASLAALAGLSRRAREDFERRAAEVAA